MTFREASGDRRDPLLAGHRLWSRDRLIHLVGQDFAAVADPRQRSPHRILLVHRRVDTKQHTSGRGLDVDHRLVGLHGEQRRTLHDLCALGHVPLHHLAPFHGVAERGQLEPGRHQPITRRTAAQIASVPGTVKLTSSSANGMGTCAPPTRTIGARRS